MSVQTSEPSALKWSRACFRISPFMEPSSRWKRQTDDEMTSIVSITWLSMSIRPEQLQLSPNYVYENNSSGVTYSSAGHQEENNPDINNHRKTQPGRICRQQPTLDLTREPSKAVQLSTKVSIKAKVQFWLALYGGALYKPGPHLMVQYFHMDILIQPLMGNSQTHVRCSKIQQSFWSSHILGQFP